MRCTGLSLSRPLLLWSTSSRRAGSVVVAHGPSCSAACGIFPDQVSNLCPLHWQADSQPLCHQGSPIRIFLVVPLLHGNPPSLLTVYRIKSRFLNQVLRVHHTVTSQTSLLTPWPPQAPWLSDTFAVVTLSHPSSCWRSIIERTPDRHLTEGQFQPLLLFKVSPGATRISF